MARELQIAEATCWGTFFSQCARWWMLIWIQQKKRSRQAIESSTDPLYVQFGRLCLGWAYLISGQFEDAEEVLQQVVDFSEERGEGQFLSWAHIFLGSTLIGLGSMKQGMKMLERAREAIDQHQRKGCQAFCEYALGKVYSLISTGPKPFFSVMAKNIGFLVKNLPFSDKKAVSHLNRTIEASRQIGARGGLGLACLDLGMFYKSKHETALAHECLTEAIKTFEGIGAENTLRQAKDALEALR